LLLIDILPLLKSKTMDDFAVIFLGASLFIIMLGMGLSLVPDDFKRIFKYPKAIVVGLTNQLILLPLIGFAIATAFSVRPEIAIGIMILAACPGGPTSNLIAHLAKADVALSVSLTALSSFITILTIPFIVNFALIKFASEGEIIQLPVVETIVKIMVITIIPVIVGMIIRGKKEAIAKSLERPVKIASGVLLVIVILGIVLKEKDNFVSYFEQAGLVAFLLNVATMVVGYLTSRMFKIRDERARSISIESGIQNGTLAIAIATGILEYTPYAIAPAVYSLIMFFTGGVIIFLGARRVKMAATNS
jgi:BASS family bile acid:Na+ symporter